MMSMQTMIALTEGKPKISKSTTPNSKRASVSPKAISPLRYPGISKIQEESKAEGTTRESNSRSDGLDLDPKQPNGSLIEPEQTQMKIKPGSISLTGIKGPNLSVNSLRSALLHFLKSKQYEEISKFGEISHGLLENNGYCKGNLSLKYQIDPLHQSVVLADLGDVSSSSYFESKVLYRKMIESLKTVQTQKSETTATGFVSLIDYSFHETADFEVPTYDIDCKEVEISPGKIDTSTTFSMMNSSRSVWSYPDVAAALNIRVNVQVIRLIKNRCAVESRCLDGVAVLKDLIFTMDPKTNEIPSDEDDGHLLKDSRLGSDSDDGIAALEPSKRPKPTSKQNWSNQRSKALTVNRDVSKIISDYQTQVVTSKSQLRVGKAGVVRPTKSEIVEISKSIPISQSKTLWGKEDAEIEVERVQITLTETKVPEALAQIQSFKKDTNPDLRPPTRSLLPSKNLDLGTPVVATQPQSLIKLDNIINPPDVSSSRANSKIASEDPPAISKKSASKINTIEKESPPPVPILPLKVDRFAEDQNLPQVGLDEVAKRAKLKKEKSRRKSPSQKLPVKADNLEFQDKTFPIAGTEPVPTFNDSSLSPLLKEVIHSTKKKESKISRVKGHSQRRSDYREHDGGSYSQRLPTSTTSMTTHNLSNYEMPSISSSSSRKKKLKFHSSGLSTPSKSEGPELGLGRRGPNHRAKHVLKSSLINRKDGSRKERYDYYRPKKRVTFNEDLNVIHNVSTHEYSSDRSSDYDRPPHNSVLEWDSFDNNGEYSEEFHRFRVRDASFSEDMNASDHLYSDEDRHGKKHEKRARRDKRSKNASGRKREDYHEGSSAKYRPKSKDSKYIPSDEASHADRSDSEEYYRSQREKKKDPYYPYSASDRYSSYRTVPKYRSDLPPTGGSNHGSEMGYQKSQKQRAEKRIDRSVSPKRIRKESRQGHAPSQYVSKNSRKRSKPVLASHHNKAFMKVAENLLDSSSRSRSNSETSLKSYSSGSFEERSPAMSQSYSGSGSGDISEGRPRPAESPESDYRQFDPQLGKRQIFQKSPEPEDPPRKKKHHRKPLRVPVQA